MFQTSKTTMTKQIKVHTAVFDIPIRTRQIKNFRAAVNEVYFSREDVFKKLGLSAELFMNRNENSGYSSNLYDYPLIQYQSFYRAGFRAAITGIEEGAEATSHLLRYKPPTITFDKKTFDFTLVDEIEQDFKIGMVQIEHFYRINYWLPLNPENYTRWKNSAGLHGRITILNKCLAGHVKSFLRRMHFGDQSSEIQVKIHDIEQKHNRITLHGQTVICYSVIFRSNVCLPDNIGLGQGVSFGFGRIKRINNNDS
jgi:hypothetical protein